MGFARPVREPPSKPDSSIHAGSRAIRPQVPPGFQRPLDVVARCDLHLQDLVDGCLRIVIVCFVWAPAVRLIAPI